MKKVFSLIVSGMLVLAATAQTADEIVQKYVNAVGGVEELKKVTTVVQHATLATNGIDVAVKNTVKCGVGQRLDINVMNMTGYDITTVAKGWKMMPWEGSSDVVDKNEEQVKAGQDGLICFGALVQYATNKVGTVTLEGTEKVDNSDCHKLKYINGDLTKIYYIDKVTSFNVKQVKLNKDGGEDVSSYSEFKKVGNVTMPHSITTDRGNMVINKIEVNTNVEDSYFKPE